MVIEHLWALQYKNIFSMLLSSLSEKVNTAVYIQPNFCGFFQARRPISQTVYMNLQLKFCSDSSRSNFDTNHPNRKQIRTCHDSWAVVACAKLWPYLICSLLIKILEQCVCLQDWHNGPINRSWKGPHTSATRPRGQVMFSLSHVTGDRLICPFNRRHGTILSFSKHVILSTHVGVWPGVRRAWCTITSHTRRRIAK